MTGTSHFLLYAKSTERYLATYFACKITQNFQSIVIIRSPYSLSFFPPPYIKHLHKRLLFPKSTTIDHRKI